MARGSLSSATAVRTPRGGVFRWGAAWLQAARHAGVTLALALIAPIAAVQHDGAVTDAAAVALVPPALHAVARPQLAPAPVTIADPCAPRDLPATGGIDGFVQDAALTALDRAACRCGSSREELALALADPDDARAFRTAHGVDPRSTGGLLDILGITLG